ncbi:MAG: hypothetical protein ABF730_07360, partial [Bifidobacterium aquikefiri]
PRPLSSRASGASREISPLQASTAKIPRLATLARDDNGVVAHMTDSLCSLGVTALGLAAGRLSERLIPLARDDDGVVAHTADSDDGTYSFDESIPPTRWAHSE